MTMNPPANKQPNSRMCFVCGLQNPIGLKIFFYDQDENRVMTRFTPREEHQGYPGVVHGGILFAILDEVMGRTTLARGREQWMMTARFSVRFHKSVPVGRPITVTGEILRLTHRGMNARGEIRLDDGSLAAEAEGLFVRIPEAAVERLRPEVGFWQVVPD